MIPTGRVNNKNSKSKLAVIGGDWGGGASGGAVLSPPANTVAPVISGNTQVGQTLSTTDGTWNNSPDSFAYQWERDGSDIVGATNNTYVLTVADAGADIICEVTASNGAGAGTPADSNTLGIDVHVVFLDSIEDPDTATTYNDAAWQGISFGTAAANRKIVVAYSTRQAGGAPTFSSGTIGGVAAASVATAAAATDTNRNAILIADVPTGTSGDISITLSGNSDRLGAGVYAVYGAGNSTPTDTATQTADNTDTSLDVPAKGVAIAVMIGTGNTLTVTWTNITEQYDGEIEAAVLHSGAMVASNAGATITAKFDIVGTVTTTPCGAYAAWGP